MYYVYILKSDNFNQTYVGFTSDLKRRLNEHNYGACSHTKKFKPWSLICYFAFLSEFRARSYEEYLKTGSGIAFARKHYL